MRKINPMLAYYDTLRSGLVPCKVLFAHPDGTVDIKVTAKRYAYPRGFLATGIWHHSVIPRRHPVTGQSSVRRSCGVQYIRAWACGYNWRG